MLSRERTSFHKQYLMTILKVTKNNGFSKLSLVYFHFRTVCRIILLGMMVYYLVTSIWYMVIEGNLLFLKSQFHSGPKGTIPATIKFSATATL